MNGHRLARPAGVLLRAAAVSMALGSLSASAASQQPDSIWYHERGTQSRPLPEGDTRLATALELTSVLRDGRVPGFYDGQFAAFKERFDDLAAIANDPDMNHVLRVVAVMALQEASDGERLRHALEPLLMSADDEFAIEFEERRRDGSERDDEDFTRELLAAELSQHARFSLAKDGQPEQVLAKIRVMENSIHRRMDVLLDPSVRSEDYRDIYYNRLTVFAIGYHFQQFDDYLHATEWFQKLCQALPGHSDTRMAHYNLGCIEALSGRPDSAMEHLRSAYAVGFTNVAWLEEDGDLTSLHERPDFAALVAQMRNQEPPVGPSEGGEAPGGTPAPAEPMAPGDSRP